MSQTLNLKIFHGDQLIDEKTLTQDVIKIGKLKSSHLCLEDDSVARMHAVIEVSGADVRVIDLGSAAGTLLNAQKVEKNAVLQNGDELSFGPYRVRIEFVMSPVAATAAPGAVASTTVAAAGMPMSAAPAGPIGGAPMGAAPMSMGAPMAHAPMMGGATLAAPVGSASRPVPTIDPQEYERQDGTRVTEVVSIFGRTVFDVQHVGQVKPKHQTSPWLILAGSVFVAGGTYLFAHDLLLDWEKHEQAVEDAREKEIAPPAYPEGYWGLSWLGALLALGGMAPIAVGLVRLNDRGVPNYDIGEGDKITFATPVHGLPDSSMFPLVQGGPDGDSALNFTSSMTGEVSIEGQKVALNELVSAGRAVTGSGGAYTYPLPPGAQCRVQHEGLTFLVNSVPPGRALVARNEVDVAFWIYQAASLVVIGSLLVMTMLIPEVSGGLESNDPFDEDAFVGYITQPDEEAVEEEIIPDISSGGEAAGSNAGGTGERHVGDEGKMGKPDSASPSGFYAAKGPPDAVPQLARNYSASAAAREGGILGELKAGRGGGFLVSDFGDAFQVGNDAEDIMGGLSGTDFGEANGVIGGLGLLGDGRGGGGTGEGTVGLGKVGLMGRGSGTGTGTGTGSGSGPGYGNDKTAGFGPREARKPRVRVAKANVKGALDADIIRRIVRAHINEIRHCYNQGLVRDPNLKGRVVVQFKIGPTGNVPAAVVQSSTVKDNAVNNCVAKAVRRWTFPKPPSGGMSSVTYPFILEH